MKAMVLAAGLGTRLKPMLLRRVHSPLVDRYITVSQDLKRYLVDRVHVRPQRIAMLVPPRQPLSERRVTPGVAIARAPTE